MTYATLMVKLELGQANAGILQIAGDLAERFNSRVVGIVAGQAFPVVYDEGYRSGGMIEQDLARLDDEIGMAEREFRAALHRRNTSIKWRSKKLFGPGLDYLVSEARCADLFVTGAKAGGVFDGTRHQQAGDLVLQIGRPILIVQSMAKSLELHQIVVCWKDTREARRAVHDALPLLQKADRIHVVEVAHKDDLVASRERLDDVVAYLKQHRVAAIPSACASIGDDKRQLEAIFEDCRADLVVAGAYGHSRVREWALGGVSRDLIVHSDRCSLLSH